MELAILKNRIKKNQNILKITNSLKIMSMTRLKNLKKNKDNLIKYCNDIKNNIICKEEEILDTYEDMENIEKKFYINVFLFTDMSFCGTLNKQNENFIKNIKKDFNNQKDIYSLIIGFKGEKYQDINFNIEYLCKLYDGNMTSILNKKIQEIIEKKIPTSFKKLIINLYSYEEKLIEIEYITKKINNIDNINYLEFYSKYLLNSNLVNYKYEECKRRLMKVTTAIKNSEKLNHELEILYNKKRQEMITKDLLEVISGSQVEILD